MRYIIRAGFLVSTFLALFLADTQKNSMAEGAENYRCKDCNVIMISINNIGVEHMSLYGYERKTTSLLDQWARDAVVFENAFSPGSWTLPVGTSLFTSLYPYSHKVVHRLETNLLDKNIKTFPEILKDKNYKTAAFTGGLDYYKEFGHMRGFENIDDNPNFTGFDVVLPQAKKWLSQNSNKRFFLFIHGYTAHPPFNPPEKFKGTYSKTDGKKITVDPRFCVRGYKNSNEEYEAFYLTHEDPFAGTQPNKIDKTVNKLPKERRVILKREDIDYLRDLYDETILYEDSMVGDFLNSLDEKILRNTVIVIFSEHGEMFAKHGRFGRTGTIRGALYDEVIHVPLMIRLPSKIRSRIAGLVQIIDIMPTLLNVLDIDFSQVAQGKSLLPLLEGNKPVNEYVYAGLPYNINKQDMQRVSLYPKTVNEAIRGFKWKLIREVKFPAPKANDDSRTEETFELYDLNKDPSELDNVIDKYPDTAKDLKEKLGKWADQAKKSTTLRPSTVDVPEDLKRDAMEHGYW